MIFYDLQKFFPLVDFFYNFGEYENEFVFDKLFYSEEVINFYSDLVKNSFLKNIKSPFWIVNKSVQEENYKIYSTLKLSEAHIKYLNENGISLYITEPLNFYEDCFEKNDLLYYIDKFAKNNNLKKLTVFTCEKNISHLNKIYKNIKILSKNVFLTIVSCSNNLDFIFDDKKDKIVKKFWCGNIEYNQHRHFIMCFLFSKSGNYSWYHKKKILRNKFYCPKFLTDINIERNFIDTIAKHNDKYLERLLLNDKELNLKCPVIMDNKRSSKNSSIIKFYDECFCAIITETIFNSPYSDISEKTLYAIAYGKPFIVVGTSGCLEYLKSLGFMTFEDFWDESYDFEKDAQKRMLKIFDLIEHIDSFSIDELKNMYEKMLPILKHNMDVLKTLQYNDKVFT